MKLFRYMIVENRDVLKEAFSNLYFIPEDIDTPELIELNDIIRKENGISSNTEFKTILRLYSNSMANENNDVRRFTLEKLATILEVNQVQVQALVASNEMTDPIISEVIQQLLKLLLEYRVVVQSSIRFENRFRVLLNALCIFYIETLL